MKKIADDLITENGVFYITLEELYKNFTHICVASYRITAKYSYIKLVPPYKSNSFYYNFEIA